jgi:outer membrane biosynthesis protein TonB
MSSDLRPALIGSAALHLSLLAAGLIAWPHFSKPIPTAPVAVTLVPSAPVTDVRPAVEAPEVQTAAAPEPRPEPQPEPVAEAPEPTPAPPKPTPPKPTPTPPTPAPKPAEPEPKPQPKLDLDALASKLPKPKPQPKLDLNALASRLPKRTANAERGPARPETAVQSRAAAGAAQGLTADEASLLASKLNRLWNPNCGAEGAGDIQVKVNMRLTQTGALAAPPTLMNGSGDPVWQAAAQRALSAVARGAPYDELPRERYGVWKDIIVNFDGRQACRMG